MNNENQPILFLTIEGALQSWGTRSQWYFRDSGLQPTKSAIIGLIGCAMGVPRQDPYLENLDKNLKMGVRVERPGNLMEDFQTITMNHLTAAGKNKGVGNTVISRREYLQDAAFIVTLQGKLKLLQKIKKGLKNPVWPIYLGRKCCIPSRPLYLKIDYSYPDIETALTKYPMVFVDREKKSFTKKQNSSSSTQMKILFETKTGDLKVQDKIKIGNQHLYGYRTLTTKFVSITNPSNNKQELNK